MEIEIKRKHFLNSTGYISNNHCPLALAAKEYFKTKNIVGYLSIIVATPITEEVATIPTPKSSPYII